MINPYTYIINFSQLSSYLFSSLAGILLLTFPILLVYLSFLCGSSYLTGVACQSVGRRLLTGARTIDGRKWLPFSGQPLIAYSVSGKDGASWVHSIHDKTLGSPALCSSGSRELTVSVSSCVQWLCHARKTPFFLATHSPSFGSYALSAPSSMMFLGPWRGR